MPEIQGYRYDFDREEFTDKDGVVVTPERFAAAAARDNAGRARAGEATVRRAIFIKALISSPSSQRPRLLEKILARSRTLVTQGGLDAMFNRKVPDKTCRKEKVQRYILTDFRLLEAVIHENGHAYSKTLINRNIGSADDPFYSCSLVVEPLKHLSLVMMQ